MARDEELRLARRALDSDTVRALLVYGPAGIGKTRFAEECLRLAEEAGHPVARALAGRAAAGIPLGALIHLLPAGLGSDTDPARLIDRARQDLAALGEDGRLVLLIDDLPLLDPLSLTLLVQLVDAGVLFLVGTLRTGEPVPDVLTALWAGDRVLRVDLAELDRPGTESLLHEVLGGQVGVGALAEFWPASQGNPLYLRELVLGAAGHGTLRQEGGVWRLTGPLSGSPRLLELVGDRLRDVTDAGRPVLDRLALCQPLGLDELVELAEVPVLEELESAGLIDVRVERRRHQVSLSHPVYAQTLQAAMSRIRGRATLLDQVARTENRGARRREDPLRVAVWRLDATGTAEPRLLLRAARLARGMRDHERLERLARGVLAARDDAEARLLLAEALVGRGHFAEADGILAEADALPAPADLRLEITLTRALNAARGLHRPDRALELLARAGGPDRPADVAALAALVLGEDDRPAAALEELPPMPDEAPRTPLRRLAEAQALALSGDALHAVRILDSGEAAGGVRLLHESAVPAAQATVAYEAGRFGDAIALMTRALDAGGEPEPPQSTGGHAWRLARMLLGCGRPRAAARWARDAIAIGRHPADPALLTFGSACLAAALAQVGDVTGARAALAELAPGLDALSVVPLARAWTAAAGGDPPGARDILLAAADEAQRRGQVAVCAGLLHDVARLGDPHRVAARLGELTLRHDSPLIAARAAYARGAAARDGALLEEAAETFTAMGATLWAAESEAAASASWRADGEARRATAAAARSAALAQECEGARSPALAGVPSVDPLTPREREICLLAARGVTSRQIAERLVLSVRTVNNHLQNAYTKLGVGSRSELATLLETAS